MYTFSNFRSNERYFSDNAFHTYQIVKVPTGEGARGDVFSPKTPLKPNVEVFVAAVLAVQLLHQLF